MSKRKTVELEPEVPDSWVAVTPEESAMVPDMLKRTFAISLIARGFTTKEVSQNLQIKQSSIYRWEKDPKFLEAVDQERQVVCDRTLRSFDKAMKVAGQRAMEALISIACDPNTPYEHRAPQVNAAKIILDRAFGSVTQTVASHNVIEHKDSLESLDDEELLRRLQETLKPTLSAVVEVQEEKE